MLATVIGRSRWSARAALLFFISLTVIALIAQTWWTIAQDRLLTVEAEKTNSLTVVRGLNEQASRILDEAAHMTADAGYSITPLVGNSNRFLNVSAVYDILVSHKLNLTPISALWVTNAAGITQAHSARHPALALDLSTQKFTQYLHAHPEYKGIFIGTPIRSEYDGEWIIPVARNLHNSANKRIGIIGASIHVSYFTNFYAKITDGKNANVSFRSNDGYILARFPHDEKRLGKNISENPVFARINNGPMEGTFDDLSIFTNTIRLFAYHKASNYPLTTTYSLDMDSVLAPWRARSAQRIVHAGATILLICLLTFFLMLHIRRLHDSEKRLTASENRYRTVYEGATDAVFLLDHNQTFIDCNNATIRLFGLEGKENIIGHSMDEFFNNAESSELPALPAHSKRQEMIDAALAGEPQQCEWPIKQAGRQYVGDITLSRASMGNEPLVLCIFRDISARKQSEEVQKDQNRILHIIASGADLHRILNEIVLFIEKRAPHSQCMILLLNDERTRFSWGVGPNIPPPLLQRLSHAPIISGNSAASEAILTQYPVMVENIETHPSMREVRDMSIAAGFYACGSWPIMGKRGQIMGAFLMFFGKQGTPSTEDVQLVGISTDLAGIAIESRRAEDRIKRLAHYDELTGLPNRFLYIQYLNRALAQAERSQSSLGVLFLDLDRFKNINDTFGHDAGDAVLRAISTNFRSCLRDADTIARVGGDEFIILASDYGDPRMLGDIAKRLLIEAAKPFDIDGQECQLSASIGIAAYPVDGLNAQMLLKNADIAMYRAKSTGRNNYQFYSSEMNTHTVERLAMEARLRRAIERREIIVHYQPKINARTGQIVGAEALVRWQHPEHGILLPGQFIGLAEEAGLIDQIGMLVLEQACQGITAFRKAGVEFGRVAINLSAGQFNAANLLHDVLKVLNTWHLDPAFFELEITESMVMHNREQVIELMENIRSLGFTLSIDDFGTGYSSLAYLKRFPVDSVKVDKSFINDIPHDPNDLAIVQAIIAMAHTLGLKVIAEGVENALQLNHLLSFGCDEYQGFYFSRAVPEEEFIAMARKNMLSLAG